MLTSEDALQSEVTRNSVNEWMLRNPEPVTADKKDILSVFKPLSRTTPTGLKLVTGGQ